MRADRLALTLATVAGLAAVATLLMGAAEVGFAQLRAVWWVVLLVGGPPAWLGVAVWLARDAGPFTRRLVASAAGLVAVLSTLVLVQVAADTRWLSQRWMPLDGVPIGRVGGPAVAAVVTALGAAVADRWRRRHRPEVD